MGSGRKSNGIKPVNKVDGPKKRGKKSMRKSRRKSSGKVTLKQFQDHVAWMNKNGYDLP